MVVLWLWCLPPTPTPTTLHYLPLPPANVSSICPLRYSGRVSYTGGIIIIVVIHRHKHLQCCCCCVGAAVDCRHVIRRSKQWPADFATTKIYIHHHCISNSSAKLRILIPFDIVFVEIVIPYNYNSPSPSSVIHFVTLVIISSLWY